MAGRVVMLGSLDTKGVEYAYLRSLLLRAGIMPMVVDVGVLGAPLFKPDVPAEEIAAAAGADLGDLRAANDRGAALAAMAQGAAAVLRQLYDRGQVSAVLGMGGSGGSSVIAAAMRALPIGVPKVLVSTMASGDTRPYVGLSDIMMLPSLVDVAGLNRISRRIIANAASAITGMIDLEGLDVPSDRPLIAASMFGNTTQCVDRCRATLELQGFEVLVFHATGTGGQMMEQLIADAYIDGVLDLTTTEWADQICGGVLSAGPERLSAAALAGIPQVVAPGCIDMCNFGPRGSLPAFTAGRLLYEWNPTVTLMRTNADENAQMGAIFAEKLNRASAPVHVLIPRRGFSLLDSPGGRFWNPEADAAFVSSLRFHLRPEIPIEELDLNINDPAFADRAAQLLLEMMPSHARTA